MDFTDDTPIDIVLRAGDRYVPSVTIRMFNALANENIKTLGQLLKYTPQTLLRIPNFGRRTLAELLRLLQSAGYTLAADTTAPVHMSYNEALRLSRMIHWLDRKGAFAEAEALRKWGLRRCVVDPATLSVWPPADREAPAPPPA